MSQFKTTAELYQYLLSGGVVKPDYPVPYTYKWIYLNSDGSFTL